MRYSLLRPSNQPTEIYGTITAYFTTLLNAAAYIRAKKAILYKYTADGRNVWATDHFSATTTACQSVQAWKMQMHLIIIPNML